MTFRIRQNAWGAWKGYIGTKHVITFGNTTPYIEDAEKVANLWLDRMNHLKTCEACK